MITKPFNNRMLIEEVKEKDIKIGNVFVPEEVKERKNLSKYLRVKILDLSPDLEKFNFLINKEAIVETGFLEEIRVDGKIYRFIPFSYIVCTVENEDKA